MTWFRLKVRCQWCNDVMGSNHVHPTHRTDVSVQGEPLPPPQFRDRLRVLELEFGVLCREEQISRDRHPTRGFSIEFKLDCREEVCRTLRIANHY
jgi:hypothetical protein